TMAPVGPGGLQRPDGGRSTSRINGGGLDASSISARSFRNDDVLYHRPAGGFLCAGPDESRSNTRPTIGAECYLGAWRAVSPSPARPRRPRPPCSPCSRRRGGWLAPASRR